MKSKNAGLSKRMVQQFLLILLCLSIYQASSAQTCSPPTENGCLNAGTVSLQSGGQGSTSLAVTWTQMAGNIGYYVDCKMVNSPFTCFSTTTATNVNSFTFTGLQPNTAYNIRYIAKCTATTWGWSSAPFQFTTAAGSGSCSPPTEIGCLNAGTVSLQSGGQGSTSLAVTWTQMVGNQGYYADCKMVNSPFTCFSTTTATNVNSFTFTGLQPNTAYNIRYIAKCSPTTWGWSSAFFPFTTASACTLTAVSPNPQAHTAAGQALVWNFNSTAAWTATDNQTWITVTASGVAGSPTSATITTTANTGAARSGTVTISCGGNTLAVTVNQAAGSTCSLAAPPGVGHNSLTQFSANILWTGTVPGATKYRVHYRKPAWPSFLTKDTPNGTALNLGLSNLECGASYEYKVQSICSDGSGGTFSALNSFTTTACTACTPNIYSANAASPSANIIDINVGTSTFTYTLPYIFGVNRNHTKNRYNSFDANYYTFVQSLLKKYGTNITNKKLYRHGGTMTDGNDGVVACYGMTGWRHSVQDGQDGPYPYDKLSNYTGEASASYLNADMTVTVNFGSGTAYDAGQLVLKLKNAVPSQLGKVKFFELGNEITLVNQFGNGSRTSQYGNCVTCPFNSSDIDCYPTASSVYDLNDKCSSPVLYAEKAAAFIKEMVTQAGAGNKLKIGLVLGHDTEMKGSNAWANDVNTNIITIMNKLKSLIGATAPNQVDNIESQVDLFFTFHGYGGWPILNGLQDPGPNVPGYHDAAFAKGLFAAPFHAEKRIRDLLYSNLSCKTDKVFGNPAYLWNNIPIKLGNTEYSSYMFGVRDSLHYTVTEALLSADNMLNALKLDMEMSVAYGIHHDDPNSADDLFFDPYNSNITYNTNNLGLIGEKCIYKLHDFFDQYIYNKVIATYDGASTLYKVTNFPLRQGTGQNSSTYAYPALSFGMTQNGTLNQYAMVVLNRSDVTQKATNLFLTALPTGTYSAVKHTLKANSVKDLQFLTPGDSTLTSGTSVVGGKLTLPTLYFPKYSLTIITFNRTGNFTGGGTESDSNSGVNSRNMLYPNPANTEITLLTQGNMQEGATISIQDIMGRTLKVVKTELVEGLNENKLDITDLAPGVYYVNLQTENTNQKTVLKFVKSTKE